MAGNNAKPVDGLLYTFTEIPKTGKTYYFEIIRLSATAVICNLYDDLDFTNLVETSDVQIISADIIDLNNLRVMNNDSSSVSGGSLNGQLDNVSVYDNFAVLGVNADGAINGATTGVVGIRDKSYSFDGADDYVDSGINLGFQHDETWSVSYWANRHAIVVTSETEYTISNRNAGNDRWGIYNNDEDYFKFIIEETGSGDYIICSVQDFVIPVGQWIHYAVVYHGDFTPNCAEVDMYIDGVLHTNSHAGSGTVTNISTDANLKIGTYETKYFDGKIDDVSIFYTGLTSSQVQQLYNNGTSLDIIP